MNFAEKSFLSNFKIIKLENRVRDRKFIVLHNEDFCLGILKRNENLIMEKEQKFLPKGVTT